MSESNGCALKNTDRELWRKNPGDYYSPSIHVTQKGDIGINVGGYVLVASVERWHKALKQLEKRWENLKQFLEIERIKLFYLVEGRIRIRDISKITEYSRGIEQAFFVIGNKIAELEKECDSKKGKSHEKS